MATRPPAGPARAAGGGPWWKKLLRRGWQPLLWGLFLVSTAGLIAWLSVGEPVELPAWIPTTPAPLIVVHALLVGVAVPNTVFCVAAGLLFGPVWGSVIASIGTWLGSLTAFWLARLVLRRFVERVLARFPVAAAVFRVLGAGGVRVVLLTRLPPLIPFAAQNYGWAVTPVSFRTYAVGSLFAIPLGASFFAQVGAAGSASASLVTGQASMAAVLTLVSAVAMFFLVRWVGRTASRALERELDARRESPERLSSQAP